MPEVAVNYDPFASKASPSSSTGGPTRSAWNDSGFGDVMDQTFGKGKWRQTGGWRSEQREDQLRAQGAETVPAGHLSAHSMGSAGAPGARDVVVEGVPAAEVVKKLKAAGVPWQFFPEGASGGQGAHLHIRLPDHKVREVDYDPFAAQKPAASSYLSDQVPTDRTVPRAQDNPVTAPLIAKHQGEYDRLQKERERLRQQESERRDPLGGYGKAVGGAWDKAKGDVERQFTIPHDLHELGERALDMTNPTRGAMDALGAVAAPFIAGPSAVVERATRYPLSDQQQERLAEARAGLGPGGKLGELAAQATPEGKGIDLSQALLVLGPEAGALGEASPSATAYAARFGKAPAAAGAGGATAPTLTEAQRAVVDRLIKSKKGPSAQDMLDLAKRHPDKPLTLMDVGGPKVRGLAGKIARDPESGGEIEGFLRERTRGQTERLDKDVAQNVSAKGSSFEAIQGLKSAREAAAEPLYKEAHAANPVVHSSVFDEVVRTPEGKRAWAKARAAALKRAIRNRRPPADKFSLEVIDKTKQYLDDEINSLLKAGHNNAARDLIGMKQELLDEIDDIDKNTSGGKYKAAREAWSGATQSEHAVEFGRMAINGRLSEPEITAAMKKLSENDKEFARLGAAEAIRDIYWKVSRNLNSARAIADNPAFEARIRPLFDSKEKYERFVDSVLTEDAMFKTDAEVLRGSQTAARQAEDAASIDPRITAALDLAHAGAKAKTGNVLGALNTGARAVSDFATRIPPEKMAEIEKILTSRLADPNSPAAKLLADPQAFARMTPAQKARAILNAALGGKTPTSQTQPPPNP